MSLKARLAARARATAEFPLRVDDDTAARRELADAEASGDEDRITAARDALDGCYETLRITALAPADWEALIAAHPPTEERKKAGAWCDETTFLPALLAECVDSDVTEADWVDYTTKGALTPGEVNALSDTVVALHLRAPDPKWRSGSTPTPS